MPDAKGPPPNADAGPLRPADNASQNADDAQTAARAARVKAAAARALAEAQARRDAEAEAAEANAAEAHAADANAPAQAKPPVERGGPKGPEPTRYGDWEKKGIAVDF